ncbi:Phospholipase D3 [Chionoecetes opilio]|uniref:Phospholipase D3 n=1 Tax=Chionoecetes opilio TaxID=41210 RepID=A0A8J4YFW5_CHIOP|nr:Phospholipase D3 [Chionoecetes opilio]
MKYTPVSSKGVADGGPGQEKALEEAQIRDKTVVEGSGKLDFGEYELELWDLRYNGVLGRGRGSRGGAGGGRGAWAWVRTSCVPLAIIVTLSLVIVVIALLDDSLARHSDGSLAGDQCRPRHPTTHSAWLNLLTSAQHSVDIAAFYWTLLNSDVSNHSFPSAKLGEEVFEKLKETGLREGVAMRIAQNAPSHISPQKNSAVLAALGAAKVRSLDFKRLMSGGVLHTKMWLVDQRHVYLGSANMDWRALTQVKELGIVIYNCSSLALDMQKIFDSSPPPFCPEGRSGDVDAIVDVIGKAERFVYVAVMDYFPKTLYEKKTKFWPVLDDALRRAAMERGVKVRLLASHWSHTRADLPTFLRSLSALSSNATRVHIETRVFVVPAFTPEQQDIPFSRVNHNKYMVTDKAGYIGTSNWSADYFTNTGGIGLVINETAGGAAGAGGGARAQLQALFERDWHSVYARPVEEVV